MNLMHAPDIEDLQYYIRQIKKENLDLKSNNQLLKVKIRKLHEELNKKNKQLDMILDPAKNGNVTKVLSKHGAALIMKLKDDNFALQRKLAERDLHVKKLQAELQTAKLYVNEKSKITSPSLKLLETKEILEKIENLNNESYISPTDTVTTSTRRRSRSVNYAKKHISRSVSPVVIESTTELEKNYLRLLNNNLQKIKHYGNMQGDRSNQPNQSASSNKEDTPHEEIQQLQSYLLNVLNEVDSLKNTIQNLQAKQREVMHVRNESTQSNNFTDESTEIDSEPPEVIATDIVSSNCSSLFTEGSEYEGSTDGSACETKLVLIQSKNTDEKKLTSTKSISIQTTRSFCSRTFAAIESKENICIEKPKVLTKNENTDANEYDIEIEYIN